jgi:hypothetical protein
VKLSERRRDDPAYQARVEQYATLYAAEHAREKAEGEDYWPELQDRVVVLEAQLIEARAVLREVEWCADNACPVCFLYEDSTDGHGRGPGHAPDCRLKKALGET